MAYQPTPETIAQRTPPGLYKLGDLLTKLAAEKEYVGITHPTALSGISPLWMLDELLSWQRDREVSYRRIIHDHDEIWDKRESNREYFVWRDHGLKPEEGPPTEESEPSPTPEVSEDV